jgi:capsid protein
MAVKDRIIAAWDAFMRKSEKEPEAFFSQRSGSGSYLFSSFYNGEKTLGGIGPVKNNLLDYESLRARSWDGYLTNEIVQIVIDRMTVWAIGTGLRIQSEPNPRVLAQEGIKMSKEQIHEFTEEVEARFSIFAESVLSDYAGMQNLNQKQATTMKNAKAGGDVLVVLRYVDGWVKVQLIDGCHVRSPMSGTDWSPQVLPNGNRIMNGVEMSESAEHVAYHVQNDDLTWTRISARSKTTGLRMAFFVGGLEYRLDNSRKIPATSAILETLAVLKRYQEATLGSAEEMNNIVLQIKHGVASTNENPFSQNVAKARSGIRDGKLPVTHDGVDLQNTVAASTGKKAINLPNDSELAPVHKSEAELYFKDFYSVFIDLICACFGIPPEVAMSKYDSNFSSARAAIKDWEHTLLVERYKFTCDFLQPIYDLWLHTSVFENKISAPGYVTAFMKGNDMLLQSYRKIRAIGDPVPHIDPVKEATAERIKLGDRLANVPLTTAQNATEKLGEGDFNSNMNQVAKELKETEGAGIKEEAPMNPGQKTISSLVAEQ